MVNLCKPGDIVRGIREGDTFVIKELLAESPEWEMYKVSAIQTGFSYTLKISAVPEHLWTEYRRLDLFNSKPEIYAAKLIPVVFSADCCRIGDKEYDFYVMNEFCGMQLSGFIGRLKDYEVLHIFTELNNFLSLLEKAGHMFAELRPDNILYDRKSQRLCIVDLSNVLPVGKEPQPALSCDRNSWIFGRSHGKPNRETSGSGFSIPSKSNLMTNVGSLAAVHMPRAYQQKKWNLDTVIYAVGIGSLLLFLISIYYYYF